MLRLYIVKLLLPPKSILILNVLSMPKCCCAQILLFGYFETGKVMLPVILISLASLSILMQMELTDSSMKRVKVARTEMWLSCHSRCCWLWLAGHFLPAVWGLCMYRWYWYCPALRPAPLFCLYIGNWRENKEDRCSQKSFLFLPVLGCFWVLRFGYFKNFAVLFLAVKATKTCCFQEDAALHIGSIS